MTVMLAVQVQWEAILQMAMGSMIWRAMSGSGALTGTMIITTQEAPLKILRVLITALYASIVAAAGAAVPRVCPAPLVTTTPLVIRTCILASAVLSLLKFFTLFPFALLPSEREGAVRTLCTGGFSRPKGSLKAPPLESNRCCGKNSSRPFSGTWFITNGQIPRSARSKLGNLSLCGSHSALVVAMTVKYLL